MIPSRRDLTDSALPGSTRTAAARTEVTIRRALPADARSVERLAALDSARTPVGELVLAEVDGVIVAAVPLGEGRPIADPFVHTAEIVRLLELRAAQLRDDRHQAPRAAALWRFLARPRRALAR